MANSYQPIACGLYDQLEAWAVKRIEVEIVLEAENGLPQTLHQRIDTLKTLSGIEYMTLANQMTIRLDQIVSIDGLLFKDQACRTT
ncbi:MAG: hypothetical protein OHK0053_17380 [Microscillaceae bacterium]